LILVFRLLAWTAKYESSHPMLLVLAGVFSAALFLGLLMVGAYNDHDRSSPRQGDFLKEQP
jgi:hypothetical protein